MKAAYRWLTKQQARRLLLAAPQYELHLQHFALLKNYPVQLHSLPTALLPYDFTVSSRGTPTSTQPAGYQPLYPDNFVVIYGPPPTRRR